MAERNVVYYRSPKPVLKLPDDLQALRDRFTELSREVQKKRNISKPVIEHRRSQKRTGQSLDDDNEQEKKLLRGMCRGLWECLHGEKVSYHER